jgi:hypothetical protein
MMMTVELVSKQSSFNNGLSKDVFVTSPLSISASAIISVRPSSQSVNEINGKHANSVHFTEIVYSLGHSVATIVVLGEYSDIVKKIKGKKILLNG